MSKLTWHDVKMYGAGMLAGMGLYWGVMQYANHKETKEIENTNTQITMGEFNINYNDLKESSGKTREIMTVTNKEDSTLVLKAIYQYGTIKGIDLRDGDTENELVNTDKLDSLRRHSLNEISKRNWIENYYENLERWKNTHRVQCDTLIRTEIGSIYNVSDLTGDGEYDQIFYIGRTSGAVADIRLAKDSTEFNKTLEYLMNQN